MLYFPLILSMSKGERSKTKPGVFPLWFDKLTMSGNGPWLIAARSFP